MAVYLLSIKPWFAKQIYEGIKKYELRRKVGVIEPHSDVIIYESAPVKAVTGVMKVGEVRVLPPEKVELMVLSGELKGCGEADLKYVSGERPVLVIEVIESKKLRRILTLEDLRAIIPGFKPPLSYIRLDYREKYVKLVEKVFSLI